MRANITTRRWCDTAIADEGYRLLVCRFRPRGVPREGEPWDAFCPELGPSVELHAAYYGKHGPPIAWEEYAARYLVEMRAAAYWIRGFAESVARGEPLALLCSSACTEASRCHRTLLRVLLRDAVADVETKARATPPNASAVSRVVKRPSRPSR